MTRLLALASGKGGSGRSTLALALGAQLAQDGARVAVVDLDPQAGATDYAGLEPADDPLGAGPVDAHGFTIYRAGRALAHASDAQIARHLERALSVGADVAIADCSPAWTDAGHRALLARPDVELVLVVRLDAGGIRGARELSDLARARGIQYRVVGTFAKRWTVAQAIESSLRGFFHEYMARTVIPDDVKAAESAAAKVPLSLYTPRSRAAQAVRELAAELAGAAAGLMPYSRGFFRGFQGDRE